MIKTLIADDNLQYVKKLVNEVTNKISSIQVEYLCTNGKEALDVIAHKSLDLIILDLKMPKLNGLEVLNEIRRLNVVKMPKVIIVSGDINLVKYADLNDIVYNVIPKTDTNEIIYRKILTAVNDINCEENYDKIESMVILELTQMGYNLKHKGTKYITESIMYIYGNNDFNMLDNLEKNVYKFVAHKYKKSVENIKTNIIKSTKLVVKTNLFLTPKNVITQVLISINKGFKQEN